MVVASLVVSKVPTADKRGCEAISGTPALKNRDCALLDRGDFSITRF
jgi:hypothetical protein